MIYFADSTITFTGPARLDRALTFVEDMPKGAAVLIGDGSQVKMKKSVTCGEFRVADIEEVQAAARAARPRSQKHDHTIVTPPPFSADSQE
ncbi:hypothetical protein CfE428DRAFT_5811 [Chthoniobacter flavus Ellin428]|uniref:Uncharacterized protein n=1 Tax=Chthoniobacter flavus Ellin428 TaxID=497964 RepID=B4DA71_9BACT|nr:hypothetical protein [Chthoniobacter flavus]EDY16698.1 hypothetical protein CfE428DRAFT_5811 [Chthoniobacter flavus Ellin428]